MAKQLSKSNSPIFEAFELSKQGKSGKEIRDILGITVYKLRDIKKTVTYQELVDEYHDEINRQSDLFHSYQLEKYNNLMDKVVDKLIELTNSDNEKVALEACKYIANRQDDLYRNKVDERLINLEKMFARISEDDESESVFRELMSRDKANSINN